MNTTLEKPDGRTKAGRAARAAQQATAVQKTPAPQPLEELDPYTKDWTAGFNLVKANQPLPEDANEAMLEGGRAAQAPPVVSPAPRRNPYGGYEVTRGVGIDDDPDPNNERKDWTATRPTAPKPVVPAVFAPLVTPQPASSASGYHERRARDIIRAAHERADRETELARVFLEFPTSAAKREAFVSAFEDAEAPGPPPPTAYKDRDEAYMYWMADWHPEQFKEKYRTCPAPLAMKLLREIESR